jgi:glyoxylase-like metal-dependent hydrolase (beta-lactamase superfamily II)
VSEPTAVATEVEEVVPGVWTWRVHDDRIDFVSSAHAVATGDGVVLIDPLPLAPAALAGLVPVTAICLTASVHQRAAWRYRRELGAPVHAPALGKLFDEEPDSRYSDGDTLPGPLLAVFTPGAGSTQHTLLLDRDPRVAFTPDLFAHPSDGPLTLVPGRYMHDPEEARRSAEKLLAHDFEVLCTGHGPPVLGRAHAAIRDALAS